LFRIAIIGCGLVGRKRAAALRDATLVACCDSVEERAAALARPYGARVYTDPAPLLECSDIDVVLIATPHHVLAPLACEAASRGKHVLIEKPGARRAEELDTVEGAARRAGVLVRVGYNHRYHRAIRKARELVDSGAVGPLLFVRARYGHGGRPGYEREWRADPDISGGGELLDQGSHLIDLARWFLGDFHEVRAMTGTFFWDMPVEDNAFLLLRTAEGQVASLHASWTEWKNTFSFEIYGRTGKLEISGLGGSYGVERVALYCMTKEMGPPPTTIWEYPMVDDSWEQELAAFFEDIRSGRQPSPGICDARATLRLIDRAYQDSRT
jgi:Predicted dehydrogenases and related proteins